MIDKRQTKGVQDVFNLTSLLRGFDGHALIALQQRNLEAWTRAAGLLADATTTVAGKQMALLKGIGDIRPEVPRLEAGAQGINSLVHQQLRSGRESLEMTVKETRAMSDAVRDCWYGLADVFESCARDNLSFLEEEAKTLGSKTGRAGEASAGDAPSQRPHAVSA